MKSQRWSTTDCMEWAFPALHRARNPKTNSLLFAQRLSIRSCVIIFNPSRFRWHQQTPTHLSCRAISTKKLETQVLRLSFARTELRRLCSQTPRRCCSSPRASQSTSALARKSSSINPARSISSSSSHLTLHFSFSFVCASLLLHSGFDFWQNYNADSKHLLPVKRRSIEFLYQIKFRFICRLHDVIESSGAIRPSSFLLFDRVSRCGRSRKRGCSLLVRSLRRSQKHKRRTRGLCPNTWPNPLLQRINIGFARADCSNAFTLPRRCCRQIQRNSLIIIIILSFQSVPCAWTSFALLPYEFCHFMPEVQNTLFRFTFFFFFLLHEFFAMNF